MGGLLIIVILLHLILCSFTVTVPSLSTEQSYALHKGPDFLPSIVARTSGTFCHIKPGSRTPCKNGRSYKTIIIMWCVVDNPFGVHHPTIRSRRCQTPTIVTGSGGDGGDGFFLGNNSVGGNSGRGGRGGTGRGNRRNSKRLPKAGSKKKKVIPASAGLGSQKEDIGDSFGNGKSFSVNDLESLLKVKNKASSVILGSSSGSETDGKDVGRGGRREGLGGFGIQTFDKSFLECTRTQLASGCAPVKKRGKAAQRQFQKCLQIVSKACDGDLMNTGPVKMEGEKGSGKKEGAGDEDSDGDQVTGRGTSVQKKMPTKGKLSGVEKKGKGGQAIQKGGKKRGDKGGAGRNSSGKATRRKKGKGKAMTGSTKGGNKKDGIDVARG